MPFAITLPLDTDAARRVIACWEALAQAGLSDDSLRLGYPPHVTLAICPDNTAPDTLQRALTAATAHRGCN